jgi:hypothetical protein
MERMSVPRSAPRHVPWSDLAPGARAFRVAHAAWSVAGLLALGVTWTSAARRTRGRSLAASVAFLSLEGVALVAGRGDCPFGPFQRSLGDPVPLFELVLPPRAAKAAVPVLTVVALAGFVAVVLRPPRRPAGAPPATSR